MEHLKNGLRVREKEMPLLRFFSDAHSGFGTVNHDRGFNLDRAYIGYQYALPHGLQLKAVLDFGQSKDVNDHQRIGYVKMHRLPGSKTAGR
mgnify:CR=1 FL=1